MKLVVSIATRGRPDRLVQAVKRNLSNCFLENTTVVVALDKDDQPSIDALIKLADEIDPGRWGSERRIVASIKPREDTIAEKWNRALAVPADCYLAVGDDDPIATPGFDVKILDAASLFPDGIGMVYGHLANASFSSTVAPTRKLCEKMGNKIFPEYFPYWFCDHWTDDLAKIIGRISFADVRTDQSNPGKTQEMREPGWWATWFDAAYLFRRKQAHAIINDPEFQVTDSQRKILLNHHPLIEYRSKWINDHVRAGAKQLEGWSGLTAHDERYQRIRQRAVAMIPQFFEGMEANEAGRYHNILLPPTNVVGLQRAYA